jgi:hypothetical protein
MRPTRDELQNFAYKTLVVIGALTLCVGVSYAATTIGTNIVTDGSLNVGSLFGVATSSPGSLFSVGGVTNFTAATSTFYSSGGLNLSSGCFAVNGTCVSAGGNNDLQVSTVRLSSSQLQHLSSSPVQLVAPPGAGKAILPISITLAYTFDTAAYTNVDAPILATTDFYGPDWGAEIGWAAVFEGGSSKFIQAPVNLNGSDPLTSMDNKGLYFLDDQDWANGDGTRLSLSSTQSRLRNKQ